MHFYPGDTECRRLGHWHSPHFFCLFSNHKWRRSTNIPCWAVLLILAWAGTGGIRSHWTLLVPIMIIPLGKLFKRMSWERLVSRVRLYLIDAWVDIVFNMAVRTDNELTLTVNTFFLHCKCLLCWIWNTHDFFFSVVFVALMLWWLNEWKVYRLKSSRFPEVPQKTPPACEPHFFSCFHPELLAFILPSHHLPMVGGGCVCETVVKWTHSNTLKWLRLTNEGWKWPTFISYISVSEEDMLLECYRLLSGHMSRDGQLLQSVPSLCS